MHQMHSSYGILETETHTCFLCGSSHSSMTQEHVFPKWLQKKYNLWNQRLTLLNGTAIPYKSLKIPCCAECNNESLSQLEDQVCMALQGGYASSLKLEDSIWYLWAGKIFYGILRKELTLLHDREKGTNTTIISKETLESFSNLHLFLQSIRQKVIFHEPRPYSVLICNLHDLGNERNYFFRDNLSAFTLSLRVGDVGVIIAFQDAGLINKTYSKYVNEVNGRKLHPIQFDELYAKVSYQINLMDRPPRFLISSHVDGNTPASVHMISSASHIRQWEQEEFAHILLAYVENWLSEDISIENIFVPPDLLETWMTDKTGSLLLLDTEEWEINKT